MKKLIIGLILSLMVLYAVGCGKSIQRPIADPTPQQILIKQVEKTNWLATVGILGIGLSVFSLINGNTKFGYGGLAGFWVILMVSLSVSRYHSQMALYGTILGVVGIGGLLMYSIFIKNRALKEIIKNIQDYKNNYPNYKNNSNIAMRDIEAMRDIPFLTPYLESQSTTTKEIVKQVKETL